MIRIQCEKCKGFFHTSEWAFAANNMRVISWIGSFCGNCRNTLYLADYVTHGSKVKVVQDIPEEDISEEVLIGQVMESVVTALDKVIEKCFGMHDWASLRRDLMDTRDQLKNLVERESK